jgi:hypothetical protein
MRVREVTFRPLAGSPSLGGEARILKPSEGKTIAVLRGEVAPRSVENVAAKLRSQGFEGVLLALPVGVEFTLCEVDDGAPVRWKEDGRPSYQELEKRVKELESQVAMGSGADCAPCTVRP